MCDVSVKIEATYTGSIVVSSALQIDIVELSAAAAVGLKVKITQDIVILSYQHRRLLVCHYNTKHGLSLFSYQFLISTQLFNSEVK